MRKKSNQILFERKFAFDIWDKKTISQAFKFAEEYKKFLSENKTERKVVEWVEKEALKRNYKKIDTFKKPNFKIGKERKFYSINRNKSIILGNLGKKDILNGLKLILAHIDSPRLDLKLQPLYEKEHLAFLKTHYYGGIKKYHWPAIPLAIYGVIVRQNGEIINIEIGDKENEPVLMITDLLPHLSGKQFEKALYNAIEAEELNLLIGSIGVRKGKEKIKNNILQILNRKYKITEEDLISADLEVVPAGPCRDLGIDSSLIAGYGQDDRICAFCAVNALFETNNLDQTCVVALVDREETGSEGATGATSNFIIDFIGELLYFQKKEYNENYLRDALSLSKAISGDVTCGFDPDYQYVFDSKNTARLGAGVVIEKYTGRGGKFYTSEATAEYMAYIRNIFNKAKVNWQTGGLGKVDIGGGGTIAMFLARYNMDIVDCGPPLLSMHAPFEISHKADLYSTFRAYLAFFSN